MNKKIMGLTILLAVCPNLLCAQEMSLRDQINAVREQIRQEEELQQQLRDDLAGKDKEIADLKQRLEELEEKIGP